MKYESPTILSAKTRRPKGVVPKLDRKVALPSTEELLITMLPPRTWSADGHDYIQYVSGTPATRTDVINLQEQLDLRLQQRQARETGICPIREELYAQCFDELIRQITVQCAERGLVLLRVRDEIRQTIAAYQELYESSIAFGMRKALVAEQRKSEMQAKIKLLSAEVAELEKTADALSTRCDEMETADRERYAADEERHAAEVAKLKAVNDQLKEGLEALLAPPAAASSGAGGKKA